MKKTIKLSLSTLALLVCFTSCGKSGSNNGNTNNQETANQISQRCQGNQQCIEAEMQRIYGTNSQGYYQGNQYMNGQYYQQYQVPYYQSNNCSPCRQQYFYANQNRAYYGGYVY